MLACDKVDQSLYSPALNPILGRFGVVSRLNVAVTTEAIHMAEELGSLHDSGSRWSYRERSN